MTRREFEILMTGLKDLQGEHLDILIHHGAHPDSGNIETQRGRVLGLELALKRVATISREDLHV